MILPLTLVAVALAILLLLLYLDGGHRSSAGNLKVEELAAQTKPVDIEAFRNLVDPKEDAFLRANLCSRDFRAIQRDRARSAMEYLHNSTRNATYLLRMGEAAAQNPDPRIARRGASWLIARCSCAAMRCFIKLSCICALHCPERNSPTGSWRTTTNS